MSTPGCVTQLPHQPTHPASRYPSPWPIPELSGILDSVATIIRSATFDRWLARLRDRRAVERIVARLIAAEDGYLGDARTVGDGVSEMRIQYGPGYRLYFIRRDADVIVLLCGGDEGGQRRDIERAKRMAREWRDRNA